MLLLLRSEVKPVVCDGQSPSDRAGVVEGTDICDVLIDGLNRLSMVQGNLVTDSSSSVMVRHRDTRDLVSLGTVY